MRFTTDGETTDVGTRWDLEEARKRAPLATEWDERAERAEWTYDDGQPVPDLQKDRVLRRLQVPSRLPAPTDFRQQLARTQAAPRRWLIPKLWAWGTIPMLGGNPKAGKTTAVADLVATLVAPEDDGRRFLGRFARDPDLTEEISAAGVWLINAETPALDFVAALADAGCTEESPLTIDHLEELGGPRAFDLTDPELYDDWAARLTDCPDCDTETNEWPPAVVIVDGLTAILHAAGRGPESYGLWYAKFRQLLREIGCPNGLATAHTTMAGGHLLGGTESLAGPDGLWTYSSANADDPASPRSFSVVPRIGGAAVAKSPVTIDPDTGRLLLGRAQRRAARRSGTAPTDDPSDTSNGAEGVLDALVAHVREHPGIDGGALTKIMSLDKRVTLAARTTAVERGLVRETSCGPDCTVCERPHAKRTHFWPYPEGSSSVRPVPSPDNGSGFGSPPLKGEGETEHRKPISGRDGIAHPSRKPAPGSEQ